MNFRKVIIASLIVLSSIFIIQNTAIIEIRFLFWQLQMSGVLMFVFLVLIGVVLGWLLHGYALHKSPNDKKNNIKIIITQ